MPEPLLRLENVNISLNTPQGVLKALNNVSFHINKRETYALVGESGSGKSITAQTIMQILPKIATVDDQAHIYFDGEDLLDYSEVEMRKIRGDDIAMIFQEPMTSLNPVKTVLSQLGEVLRHLPRRARTQRAIDLLDLVGIHAPKARVHDYPHQLSGGMKQRVMIAMALAREPKLLIADEPTTALDVTIQAQILDLLNHLKQSQDMAMLLITHDLGIVKQISDRIGVMYAGQIVEENVNTDFFTQALHPYSQKLFESLPNIEKRHELLPIIDGQVPNLAETFTGCRFEPRCPFAWPTCESVAPALIEQKANQRVRCHLYRNEEQRVMPIAHYEAETLIHHPKEKIILEVDDLHVHFDGPVKAVDGVSFNIKLGQTVALVGESGCGKTTTGRAIVNLVPPTAGDIRYRGTSLTHLSRKAWHPLREDIQMIFQDPFSAMNPRMMIKAILQEGAHAHGINLDEEHLQELLHQVGLPIDSLYRYPHAFSGGQRQRICIARALAVRPRLIICDEPTSALDVSVQAQLLNLLRELQSSYDISYLFITHDMSVVSYLADEVLVMHRGRIVERGKSTEILENPQQSYTQELLAAVP